jgi:hypothetical protein
MVAAQPRNRAATAHHARVMRRWNAPSGIAFYHWRKKDESQGQRTRAMLPQRANLLRRHRAGKAHSAQLARCAVVAAVAARGDYPQAAWSATCCTDVISCGSNHIATSADVRVRRAFRTRPHGQCGKSAPTNTISTAKFPQRGSFSSWVCGAKAPPGIVRLNCHSR